MSPARVPQPRSWPGAFPIEPWAVGEQCSALLDAAVCGSLLMIDVEEMPVLVQEVLLELLAELQSVRARSAAVRLIAGTTVSLVDRVAVGTFSERLFYRLNVIHLVVIIPHSAVNSSGGVRRRKVGGLP